MVGFNNNVDYVGGINLDPNGASDGTVQYAESTTAKWIHGNDATDDSFRLSQGSALGTNDTFIMTAAGERTMPLQPAFFAFVDTIYTNVTGDGTNVFLGDTDVASALTELSDQNGDFTPGASGGAFFTAPVTGIYEFVVNITLDGLTSSHNLSQTSIRISSGANCQINISSPGAMMSSSNIFTVTGSSGPFPLTAAQTVSFSISVSGSTKVVDIREDTGGGPQYNTFVSGKLLC